MIAVRVGYDKVGLVIPHFLCAFEVESYEVQLDLGPVLGGHVAIVKAHLGLLAMLTPPFAAYVVRFLSPSH
jgi:hypothetical protein